MINFCESCHLAFEEERCPNCGNKRVREVQADDFCFLCEQRAMEAAMAETVLRNEDIPVVSIPRGSGVMSAFAVPLENAALYVPFGMFERAEEIMCNVIGTDTEAFREDLIAHADRLFVRNERIERKMKRKLKLAEEEDLLEFCKDLIANAKKISDRGQGWSAGSGNCLLVQGANIDLMIDSDSYEIIYVDRY